jgi:mannose-6-phosphate isomerase-like protein (cupin superfamily)
MTLTAVAAKTAISKSTLSRLESGQRKPSLELLLPLAEVYHLPLDELVGAPAVGDPRVRTRPATRNGRLVYPLTQQSAAWPCGRSSSRPSASASSEPTPGYEWLYVLSGEMQLIIGEHDLTMQPGEVAEFDTPGILHWASTTGETSRREIHSVHGSQVNTASPRRARRTRGTAASG